MNSDQNSNTARIIVTVAIILIGGGALAYSILGNRVSAPTITAVATSTDATMPNQTSASAAPVTVTTITKTTTTTTTTSAYKDGTYSATGSYLSPGGNEKIGVTVTLTNDVITSASVTPEPVSGEGRRYQAEFAANFQPLVVGKDISLVHLSQVSGSSLTSAGFNAALVQIEGQAKA
jgi:uncharacterized protein with FMN-binding domain